MVIKQRARVDGRTARRSDTKSSILAAATHLFVAKGMSATSVDDIAEAAQVAKGSIYYNFASKTAIIEALLAEYLRVTRETLEAASEGLTGKARQRAVLGALLGLVQDHPEAAKLMANERFRTDRPWRASAEAWRDATADLLVTDVAEARGSADELSSVVAAAMVGATLTAALEWLGFAPHVPREDVQRAVFETLGLWVESPPQLVD